MEASTKLENRRRNDGAWHPPGQLERNLGAAHAGQGKRRRAKEVTVRNDRRCPGRLQRRSTSDARQEGQEETLTREIRRRGAPCVRHGFDKLIGHHHHSGAPPSPPSVHSILPHCSAC